MTPSSRRVRVLPRLLVALAVLAGLLVPLAMAAPLASASDFLVTNCDDSGPGSLREAVTDANADMNEPHLIAFDLDCDTITLTSGQLELARSITIQGPGAQALTVSGNNASRVFDVPNDVTVTISGLTITDGNGTPDGEDGAEGGGIRNRGTLTVLESAITGNTANWGAGIDTDGTGSLSIIASTLSDNGGGTGGGAIWTGHGVTITNSTISGNEASIAGGIMAERATGIVEISFSTVASNTARSAAIASNLYASNSASFSLMGTIVSGGIWAANCSTAVGGSFVSLGLNMEDTNTCNLIEDNDSPGTDPLLGALQDNGGPTPTHALGDGSLAINRIPANICSVTRDQRGYLRPADVLCDIGAFEAGAMSPVLSIGINDDAEWTNDPDVLLDLTAAIGFDIVSYALAETRAELDAATPVVVNPAEPTFSRDDVPFTLSTGDAAAREVWLRVCGEDEQCEDTSDTIGLDTTEPVIAGAATTPSLDPYAGEWTNEPVTVTFTCADSGTVQSGIATDTVAGGVLAAEGSAQELMNTGACVDAAGNSALPAVVSNINIDLTNPEISVPEDITIVVSSSDPVAVTYPAATADDALSGVADGWPQCAPTSGSLFPLGVTEVECMAEDEAGNTGSAVFTVTVVRDWVQGCLFAGTLSQVSALAYGDDPTLSCARGSVVILEQGSDYFGCLFSGSLSQVGTQPVSSCGRGAPVEVAAGDDLYGCLFAGALSQVGTSQPGSCGRGVPVSFALVMS